MTSSKTRWFDGLLLAQGLGLLLLLLSNSRTVGDSQSMLFRNKVVESVFAG